MFYEWIIKLLGLGLLATIFFTSPQLDYQNNILSVDAHLNTPITDEISNLVKTGCSFGIEYYVSIIHNESEVYSKTEIKELIFDNNIYTINNKKINSQMLQDKMGELKFNFSNVIIKKNDSIQLFIRAKIQNNEAFTESTKLKTSALWNYNTPLIKENYIFNGAKFISYQ
jgi:hypothetical protein